MRIRALAAGMVGLALAGCGGGGGAGGGQGEAAAKACEASAKQSLGEKSYAFDAAAFAATMTAEPDGSQLLKGPITIEPGLTTESKQTLECSVRFVEGKDAPDVLRVQFIW
jgi:F0F1-type ATP synthase membrane subunit c/vacuolar-type H+-ATPase subunit K